MRVWPGVMFVVPQRVRKGAVLELGLQRWGTCDFAEIPGEGRMCSEGERPVLQFA